MEMEMVGLPCSGKRHIVREVIEGDYISALCGYYFRVIPPIEPLHSYMEGSVCRKCLKLAKAPARRVK